MRRIGACHGTLIGDGRTVSKGLGGTAGAAAFGSCNPSTYARLSYGNLMRVRNEGIRGSPNPGIMGSNSGWTRLVYSITTMIRRLMTMLLSDAENGFRLHYRVVRRMRNFISGDRRITDSS